MEKRKLGRSGLEFAPIVFGGNIFGWTADEATSHKLLDAFVEGGYSFVDTADVYSRWAPGHKGGELEVVIGSWFRKDPKKRDKVLIATKCGMEMPNEGQGLSRAHIKKSVDASLKRLNTDRIDLFQSHRDDKDTPQEETLSTYGELIKEGKIRYIGASNFEAPRLAEAAKIAKDKGLPGYVSLQPHYNLLERPLFEGELEDECVKEGLRRHSLLAAGGRLPERQIPLGGRPRQEPARRRREEVSQRQGLGRPQRARRRGQEAQCQQRHRGARLADEPEIDHRADRERHQPGTAQDPVRRAGAQARPRVDRRSRQGQRGGMTS